MKKKLDFVTNSSSTSFCAWGIEIDDYFYNLPEPVKKAIYDKYVEWSKKYNGEILSYDDFIEDPDSVDCEWIDYLSEVVGELGLSSRYYYDGNCIYIGVRPNNIPEDKTIKEAKDETKQKLEDLGFSTKDFGFILDSWYS